MVALHVIQNAKAVVYYQHPVLAVIPRNTELKLELHAHALKDIMKIILISAVAVI